MEAPQIPWEVIERIIDHSGGSSNTLRSFSSTCRQLLPRSRRMLFAHLYLKNRDHAFEFVDYLQENPNLKPVVRSVVFRPDDFAPFPLLHILPSLSEIGFTSQNRYPASPTTIPAMHQSSLLCCQRFGTHIQSLNLFRLSFATYLPFARILLAFARVKHLACWGVKIEMPEVDEAPLDVVIQRLSERMQLKTLDIDHHSVFGDFGSDASVGALLFDPDLAPSTVESLTIIASHFSVIFSNLSDWSRLRVLVLRFSIYPSMHSLEDTLERLEKFHHPTVTEVVLELGSPTASITYLISEHLLSCTGVDSSGQQLCTKLEHVLLRFPQSRIVWRMRRHPLRPNRISFWTRELGKHLPALYQRGALTVETPSTVNSAGHDGAVGALLVSPDSKWVASGSYDSTVILWDAGDGAIAQQWVAHSYKPVRSLAFSPDSRCLVSGGGDGRVVIWDLSRGARKVTTLEGGHTRFVSSCAWSPVGNVIASGGSDDATVRLWDAQTFQQLHVFRGESIKMDFNTLRFSPDGRWLAAGESYRRDYYIWNVVSGMLHRLVEEETQPPGTHPRFRIADVGRAAFDPGSMGVTSPSWSAGDETQFGDVEGRRDADRTNVTFSSDGTLSFAVLNDGSVAIWDAHTPGGELFQLNQHLRGASTCFSHCGKYTASVSRDQTVQLFRTSDGSCVTTIFGHQHAKPVYRLAFSPDGKTLSSGAADGEVIIQRMDDIIPIEKQDT
ncbi:WD40-repeat-containing domain protein [Ganoderma leucocontextum]|nr:WD40-repeat-containing domain protein [Ganoderma leucocontextum]